MLLSVGLHVGLALAALGWCRAASEARVRAPVPVAPLRVLGVLPEEAAPEAAREAPEEIEELPPAPEALPYEPEPLPEIALLPEAAAPEEAPEPALAQVVDPLALPANRRLRPPAQLRPAAVAQVLPARRPAAAPEVAPAARPTRPLEPRSTPTPAWPADVPFWAEARVGLLFLVRGDGSVGDVRVEQPSGLPALDEHVRGFVARTWEFAPPEAPRWARQSFRLGR